MENRKHKPEDIIFNYQFITFNFKLSLKDNLTFYRAGVCYAFYEGFFAVEEEEERGDHVDDCYCEGYAGFSCVDR